MTGYASQIYPDILTVDKDRANILRTPASLITEKEWEIATFTVQKLFYVRNEVLKGGAGLAAPQIGLSYPIFIYTPDRTAENLRVAINPSFKPLSDEFIEGHEACFSVPLHSTKLRRWKKIKACYQTLNRQHVEIILEDFAAKVFQHEMDHLNGKLTIDHKTAEILVFDESQSFQEFMKQVHLEDSKTYTERLEP